MSVSRREGKDIGDEEGDGHQLMRSADDVTTSVFFEGLMIALVCMMGEVVRTVRPIHKRPTIFARGTLVSKCEFNPPHPLAALSIYSLIQMGNFQVVRMSLLAAVAQIQGMQNCSVYTSSFFRRWQHGRCAGAGDLSSMFKR